MKKSKNLLENFVHGVFLVLGLITVGCVLVITVYLVISGIPAIGKIGLFHFLFGKEWASTASDPSYGILPFILTSIYGTAGAIVLGVPIGFLAAVYIAKLAPAKVKKIMQSAVSLLAGIPSVVYGLGGMLVLVPLIRKVFNVPDGASLLAAIIVLAVMILPSIIKTLCTPHFIASMQHSAFGIMPPPITPLSMSVGTSSAFMTEMSVFGSSLSWRIPLISVMDIRLSALSAPAIFAAAVSAFMLYILPSPSQPTVETIGI